jgi:glycosyltransferase involved in cell wall biosynthesis
MQILSVHNSYQIRGGEDESRESEERLMREYGHEVDSYEENNDRLKQISAIQIAARTIWSREAYQEVKRRLSEKHYDVVHVQNFFPLISPSIYYAAQEKGVPIVQTLRNYRLLCPNALFFRDGQVCEDCLGKFVPYPAVQHGCYRESRAASGATVAMLTVHRTLQTWTKQVDRYIALTNFARDKMIQGRLPSDKITVKPNFVHPDPGVGKGEGGYALYVGRLSVEKGLDTLLAAWEQLGNTLPLKIVGDGPLSEEVAKLTERLPQVEWLGRQPMAEVHRLMGEAMVLIFPSKWYETFGRVAVEAFAKGTPVVAAKIGAIAELIEHGKTGLHFNPGDTNDLVATLKWALAHPEELQMMRKEVRIEFEAKYTAQENYHRLLEIYTSVQRQ